MTPQTAKVAEIDRTAEGLGRLLMSMLSGDVDSPQDAVISYTLPADGIRPGRTLSTDQAGFFWQRPSADELLIGIGTAAGIEAIGRDRFQQLHRYFRALQTRWIHRAVSIDAPPVAFVGFSFDPDELPGPEWHELSNTLLTVPALLYRRAGGQASVTFTAPATAVRDRQRCVDKWLGYLTSLTSSDPAVERSHESAKLERIVATDAWASRIDRALSAIGDGRLEKVVLTRKVTFQTSRNLDCARILDSLRAGHEDCAQFAVVRPGCTLIGVSPERLASRSDGVVVVDAVAGTTRRGRNQTEDDRLADAMACDPKTAAEHRLVVEQIRAALEPLCTGLVEPQTPGLMRLPRVQHLWTPLRGHLHPQVSLLTLAERLHPTPAVGGSPRNAALDWLAADRNQPRGWYTGAFGWLDRGGEGELSVVLRCGLVNESTVDLFAGAGIVAGSHPDEELAETELKLLTMQGALQFG